MRARPMKKLQALLLFTLLLSAGAQAGEPPPLASVAELDVARYMGRWYEIAKFPNRFQRKCVADTSADYKLLPDRRIRVSNRCRLGDGSIDEAVGIARPTGEQAAQLKVRFAPAWLGFLPFVWGDYWVIDLDPDYQLAAVSEPKREYLWILSRTPRITPDAYAAMIRRLEAQGFDTGKLKMSLQTEAAR
jgi:apolipoprotein D and lipocalin family protein